ncbi:MAG TPA: glycosyltransferase family 2 protein [Polyangiaceae bacterium]|nr:glycosyltransferase family 2 protein [Polyangiaceae bacterium]
MADHEDQPDDIDLSVVVPVYNEEESLPKLISELHEVLGPAGISYEIVLIDDGSRDGSYALAKRMSAQDPALTLVQFRRNFGQTAAMQAGLDVARGRAIVTMDADLQNDPAAIPAMLKKLDEGYDMVAGWRANRQDAFINRKLPSFLANRIISATTKVKLHDYGCTLKAMTRDVARELRLYGEMHRFIPAVASWIGVRIVEMKVNHRARQFGTSKYGIGRTLRVVLDLMTVRFMQSYLTRPMQVFGLAGLVALFAGFGICVWLLVEKLAFHQALADRPMLLLGILLVVVGVQLLSLGLVADVLSRTYHESQDKRPYYVRELVQGAGRRSAAPALSDARVAVPAQFHQ